MWRNQEASFEFLFRKFYQYYVLRIFPDFDATDIYSPSNGKPIIMTRIVIIINIFSF